MEFRGVPASTFYLRLEDCEFRFNHRSSGSMLHAQAHHRDSFQLVKGFVLNPSGLHENTANAFKGSIENADSVTTKYVSRFDILNIGQQYSFGDFDVTSIGEYLPDSVGEERIIGGAGYHLLDSFVEPFGLEN